MADDAKAALSGLLKPQIDMPAISSWQTMPNPLAMIAFFSSGNVMYQRLIAPLLVRASLAKPTSTSAISRAKSSAITVV
jgi:hypothetical protein